MPNKLQNHEIVKAFMDFSDPDMYYLVHVVQRKKDIPDLVGSERIIRTYTIPSMEYFDRIFPEIKTMCDTFNARAYMYINRRSFNGVAKAMLKKLTDDVISGNPKKLSRLYQSCASAHSAGDGYWILDIDATVNQETGYIPTKNDMELMRIHAIYAITSFLDRSDVMPIGVKTRIVLDSIHGFHIVTKKFDTRRFDELQGIVKDVSKNLPFNVDVELKKDAMVNLYIPKSLYKE